MLQITPDTKVGEILEEYPALEQVLIEIAPVFTKLKNPVLRKTIAKVTTLKQAAVVGGVELGELMRKLRTAAGQNEQPVLQTESNQISAEPDWVKNYSVKIEYDARVDLNEGRHPVAKVTKEVETLGAKECYILVTPFVPAPLIDLLSKKGFNFYTTEKYTGVYFTYFAK